MNELKFKKLFALARKESAPTPPDDFDARVLSAVRREQRAAPVTWWEQLGELFPRLAMAAFLIIGSCMAADLYYSSAHDSQVNGDLTALSEQLQWNDTAE